jgi:hypothetical protein
MAALNAQHSLNPPVARAFRSRCQLHRKRSSHPFDQKLLRFLSQPSLANRRRWAGLNELINRVEMNGDRVSAFHSLQ